MSYDTRFKDLYEKQENQIKAFQAAQQDAQQATAQQEKDILKASACDYHNAPYQVWEQINVLREDCEHYWGNDGILLTELMRRQAKARQKVLNLMQHGNK